MKRIYTVYFSAVAITALQDLFEILAPSDATLEIHRIQGGQTSDVGDAAEELLRLESVRGVGAVTSGSGGSTATPQPIEDGDAAFGGTVEINNTTRMAAGSGAVETLEQWVWNVRMPFDHVWPVENRPIVSPGNRWALGLPAAPADSLTCTLAVTLAEIGG